MAYNPTTGTVWFNLAMFFAEPGNQLLDRHGDKGEKTWQWDLIGSNDTTRPEVERLQVARQVFEDNPALMVEKLKRFGEDYQILDVGLVLARENFQAFTFITVEIQRRVRERERAARSRPAQAAWTLPSANRHPTGAKDVYDIAAEALQKALRGYDEEGLSPDADADGDSNQSIVEKALAATEIAFRSKIQYFTQAAKDLYLDGTPGFCRFVANAETLTETITGAPSSLRQQKAAKKRLESYESQPLGEFRLALEELRRYGAVRAQQFVPMHEELKQLRRTVEQQQQVITSLEFRYVLENLPDKSRFPGSATKSWQGLWEAAVAEQLKRMKTAYMRAAAGRGPDPDPSQRPHPVLEHALGFRFDEWWRTKGRKASPSALPDFHNWDVYLQGYVLYGTLSGNIHRYAGEAYAIHKTNWPRSCIDILEFLRPTHFAGGTVDWERERAARAVL